MDIYIKALTGFEFDKSKLNPKEIGYIENKLKMPILNNMALSLMQLGKTNQQCLKQASSVLD